MRHRSKFIVGGKYLSALLAVLVLGATAGSAVAAGAPPVNTALPTISPSTPYVGRTVTASKGVWKSEAPAHWLEGETTSFPEGKSVAVASSGGPVALTATIFGSKLTFACQAGLSAATLENPKGGGSGIGQAMIALRKCSLEPASSGCSVSAGPGVSVNLALTKLEGVDEATMTPVEGTVLGRFTFSGCALEGNTATVTGVLRGHYSNSNSRVEFGSDTVSSHILKINGANVTAASGSIGLQTMSGKPIGAESMTYSFVWSRCSSKCLPIAGATAATYTPKSGEKGEGLKVAVTATDIYGSTTVESAFSQPVMESLSWYGCEEGSGGQYEDAGCTKKGTGKFAWKRLQSSVLSLIGGQQKLSYKLGGEVLNEIFCERSSGSGQLVNEEARASVNNLTVALAGCVSQNACQIPKGEITLHLKGGSPQMPQSLMPTLSFEGTESGVIGRFNFEKCPFSGFNGEYLINGTLPVEIRNSESKMTMVGTQTRSSLKIGHGGPGTDGLAIDSTNELRATDNGVGSYPVKLDVSP
jgi:hypothetical protein